ncbi:MAG: hypothetical protein WA510_21870 [Acidobacteriaceae bacterium]
MTYLLRRVFSIFLILIGWGLAGPGHAQLISRSDATVSGMELPDAPQTESPAKAFAQPAGGTQLPARRYAQVIEPGQASQPFTVPEKIVFSFTEVARPITLIPALYSAGYEQLFLTDPKYGSDAGAYGEKIGAALLRSTTVRVFSDGIFAAAFHQDPRYYRIGEGSFVRRSLLSAEQAVVRRGDDGSNQFNYSGILGRAAAAALTTTYYPAPSVTGRVVGLTFATSIATDAGGNIVLEFLPNIVRRFPIMKKLRLE